jgi:ABC-type antimicrobial peptide transport system permease subunit
MEFFPGRSALGHHVSFTDKAEFTIVGVVADNVYADLHEQAQPMAWFPLAQTGIPAMHVLLRTGLPHPETLIPQVRRALAAIDPNLALLQPRTEAAEYASTADNERLVARISLFFGLMAVVLVATGLYGTLSYRVNRRTSELGIRMALGAQKPQIVWLVVSESIAVLAIGLCIGIPLAVAEGRWLASLLYELKPYDPISFIVAGTGISLVTLAATFIPARRAAAVSPVRALRHE